MVLLDLANQVSPGCTRQWLQDNEDGKCNRSVDSTGLGFRQSKLTCPKNLYHSLC